MKTKQNIKFIYQIFVEKNQRTTTIHFATSKTKSLLLAKKAWELTTLPNKKISKIWVSRYSFTEFQELYFNSYCEVVKIYQYHK